jgi:hypothetical protein
MEEERTGMDKPEQIVALLRQCRVIQRYEPMRMRRRKR